MLSFGGTLLRLPFARRTCHHVTATCLSDSIRACDRWHMNEHEREVLFALTLTPKPTMCSPSATHASDSLAYGPGASCLARAAPPMRSKKALLMLPQGAASSAARRAAGRAPP